MINNDYSNYNNYSAQAANSNTPAEQKEQNSVFDKMNEWTDAHANNMKETSQKLNEATDTLKEASALLDQIKDPNKKAEFAAKLEELQKLEQDCTNQVEEEYQKNQEEIGLSFDFMEGSEDYDGQLLKLAAADVASKDINDDGKISLQEYVFNEVGSTDQYESSELLQTAVTNAILSFKLMDEGMGNSDKSGDLSAAEFQSFYKNLDGFKGVDNIKEDGIITDKFDGKFEIGKSDEFLSYAIDTIFSEETYNKTKELSLEFLKNY